MPRAFLLSIVLILCPGRTLPFGGTIPSGYPSNFMMGYVLEAHVDAAGRYVGAGSEFNTVDHYMASVGSGWAASYKYLIGGPRAANGGNCWWNSYPGGGGMPTNMMNLINNRGYQPIFIYENLQYPNGNYAGGIYNAFQSASFMGQYFSDWADLMTVVDTWLSGHAGKVVTIDVEPDSWGYMQQNYNSNPASIPAMVAGATNPGGAYPWVPLTGFPNTVQGAARAMLHIKDMRMTAANRSRLKLAFHVSGWAVAPNPATQQGAVSIASHASSIAGFVNACKTTITAGANWDLLFLDPADGDAGLYSTNGLDAGGTTHWWDANNVTQPTFDRYRDWVDALSGDTSLRCMLWQMPIGNQVYKTMNNTAGHYQDNKAEYFLNPTNGTAHVCDWAGHGVIGILWGRGSIIPVGAAYTIGTGGPDYWFNTWASDYSGGTQDNITNPGAGTTSTIADDDGGYLRARMPAYFASACSLPGVGTATSTPTPSPNWTPTISPTFSPSPVCPGGDIDTFEDGNTTNDWGGTWSAYNPGGGTTMLPAAFAPSAAGAATGSYGGRINGSVSGTNYPSVSAFLNAATTAQSVCTYNAIRFSFKGTNGGTYRFQVHSAQEDAPTAEYNDYYFNLLGTGTWQTVTVPYGSLTWPGYGRNYALDCSQWRYISWLPLAAGAYDMSMDDIQFVCLIASPTPTVTPTQTRTATRTPTASSTVSASPSQTRTNSASPTQTATFSSTQTRSPTPTDSSTKTVGPSSTSSATPSSSATLTPSRTLTPSSTQSSAASATSSRTPTGSQTASPATTATFSPTNTVIVPGSPTFTGTVTASPTLTRSPTPCSTRSASPSPSSSSTVTVLLSSTSTRTITSGPSPTDSPTLTATGTSSATPSLTPASSPTFTPTASASSTALQSPTSTDTITSGPSPTDSPTFTQTALAAATSTPSITASATRTPTATFTATQVIIVGTATFSSTVTTVPTAAPTLSGQGPNEVLEAWPVPHPNPAFISVHVAGACERVQVSYYSRALVCLAKADGPGSSGAGWVQVPVPAELARLPNGTYHYSVQSFRGSQGSLKAKKGSLLILR